jgi:hypothetical protein
MMARPMPIGINSAVTFLGMGQKVMLDPAGYIDRLASAMMNCSAW